MGHKVDICADVGEDFSLYRLGNYSEIMRYLTSCNCACGWHAGGPDKMRTTAKLCKQYHVHIGAHPGLPDLLGFGRREMKISSQETIDYLVYQVGALSAFTKPLGLKIQHVAPHGAWSTMAWKDEEMSKAFVDAIQEMDPEFILLCTPISVTYKVAMKAGIRVASTYSPELDYTKEGHAVLRRKFEPVKPQDIANKIIKMVKTGKISTVDNVDIDFPSISVNIHGDNPNAPEVLKVLRTRLTEENIEARPMSEMC